MEFRSSHRLGLRGGLFVGLFVAFGAWANPLAEGVYRNSDGLPIVSLISSAQASIDLEIYEMSDRGVINAIRTALKRGVRVRVVQEPQVVGSHCSVFDKIATEGEEPQCADERALVQAVRGSGGAYVPFAKSELCTSNCVQHGKILVVDRAVGMISTGNFNGTNLCDPAESPSTCNRDYTWVTRNGAVLKSIESVFEHDLAGKRYDVPSVIDPAARALLTVSPDSLKPLTDFIASARTRLQIQNQYLKDPTLNAAIEEAAKRGVRVEVNVASACSFGHPSASEAAQWKQIYGAFEAAGVHSRIFDNAIQVNRRPGYLHAKAIIVDGTRAWVGSVNGSTEALTGNREFGLFFNDAADVQKLAGWVSSDFTDARGESWEESLSCQHDNLEIQGAPPTLGRVAASARAR